jgi:pyruvate/2-oxoglutarate dehydrogenase complex dihydrolipoamide dehydrogenase (E3) component
MRYDLAVIGNDESAFAMANAAARDGLRVLLTIPEHRHSSWICAQAMHRVVTNMLAEGFRVHERLHRRTATPGLLLRLLRSAIADEVSDLAAHCERLAVDVVFGESWIVESGCLAVHSQTSGAITLYESRAIVIATGIRWASSHSPFGVLPGRGPESLLSGSRLPSHVTVLGGQEFGLGLASLLSQLGVASTVVGDIDRDDVSFELALSSGVSIVNEESADDCLPMESQGHTMIDCQRAIGLTAHLSLRTIGVEPDENGRLWCDENLQTWGRGVYGIGDAVGFSTRCGFPLIEQASSILAHLGGDRTFALKRTRSVRVARPVSGRDVLAVGSVTR